VVKNMANKDDEQVLVIKSEVIFTDGKWQGLKTESLDYYIDLIKKNCGFKRRGDMENDVTYQQVVSYIIFNFEDRYFLYKYLPGAGEKRLIDTYQIGVGGHINPIDDKEGNILEAGIMREWNEEVDFNGCLTSKKLIGIIHDESGSVERVHIGLVYSFTGDSQEISVREKDKIAGELVNLENIGEYIRGNNGAWVHVVYNEYLLKLIK